MKRTFNQPRSLRFLERLRAHMGDRMWDADELAAALYTDRQNVRLYLYHLMGATPRGAHIAGYRKPRGGGRYAYLYRLGDQPDAPHPRAPLDNTTENA